MIGTTPKKILSAVSFLVLLLGLPFSFLSRPSVEARAEDPGPILTLSQNVKVGLFDYEPLNPAGAVNESVSFIQDYFQAVAEYANWSYEYVKDDWGSLIEKLKSGTIDVMLDVSKTDERLTYFDYSDESMGTEMCYLYGRGDTTLTYNDFAAFDGMKVGYEEGSTIIQSLENFGKEKGFTVKGQAFPSGKTMFEALDRKEVDAVCQTNFFEAPSGHSLLAKCDPEPVFICTNKTKSYLHTQLNDAMALLFSYNPGFNSDLYSYHFGDALSQAIAYTQEEKDYLATKPKVYLFYEQDWAPFEYDDKGTAKGITPDVIRAIGEDTGINFEFVLTSSTAAIYIDINGKNTDAVMAVSYNYIWANDHNLLATQPYVSGAVLQVSKSFSSEPRSVAIVKDGYLASQIVRQYPNLTTIQYETFAECMEAVQNDVADCTFLNYYQANYYRSMSAYETFSYRTAESLSQSISLGVTVKSNELLLQILSKSLQHLSNSKIPSILSNNSVYSEPLSFTFMVRRYPIQTSLIIAFLVLSIAGVSFLLVYAAIRKKQNLALETAKKEADKANRAKSEFLSRMSHDIRTPLNGIIGMTSLAESENNSPEVTAYLTKIDTSSKFLLSLINDILDMSKAESGKIDLHLEPYRIDDFEDYLNAVVLPLAEKKKQTILVDSSMRSGRIPLLDKLRMNQIMFNLLSNACKFTPDGGTIKILYQETLEKDNRIAILLSVSDNGIGMSEDFLKVLFDPFTQEERSDSASFYQGSGLGMAITKRLVERMGGDIGVVSKLGSGTTFTIHLLADSVSLEEYAKKGQDNEREKQHQLSSLEGHKILLVEDNAINREIAESLLRKKGLTIASAEDGKQGVDIFSASQEGEFDAILMDIRMPVMNGYEATKAIRLLPREDAKSVPIIAMTADAFKGDVEQCLQSGMNAHLAKPINPSTLYETLALFLSKKGISPAKGQPNSK